MQKLYVLGGGTFYYVRNHLALCAPAFGSTARDLVMYCRARFRDMDTKMLLTKMADPLGLFGEQEEDITTNDDVASVIDTLKEDPDTKVIFFNIAMCDWKGEIAINMDTSDEIIQSGKYAKRLKSNEGRKIMSLIPNDKVISHIREGREDIYVVGFKTTCGATEQEQAVAGLNLLKDSNINLVLVNDTRTRINMIITPEETEYQAITDRKLALSELVELAWHKSK